jgi:hypothetical protein
MIALDRESPKALHTQIYDAFRLAIVGGNLRARQRVRRPASSYKQRPTKPSDPSPTETRWPPIQFEKRCPRQARNHVNLLACLTA